MQCKVLNQNNYSCIIDTCNRPKESCSNADCEFVPGLDWWFWLLPGSCCVFAVARCVAPWPQAWTETLLVKPFCGLTVTTTELLPWDEIVGFGEDGLRDILAVVFVQGRDAGNRMERNDLVVQLITISVAAVYNTGARRNSLATDKQLDEGRRLCWLLSTCSRCSPPSRTSSSYSPSYSARVTITASLSWIGYYNGKTPWSRSWPRC